MLIQLLLHLCSHLTVKTRTSGEILVNKPTCVSITDCAAQTQVLVWSLLPPLGCFNDKEFQIKWKLMMTRWLTFWPAAQAEECPFSRCRGRGFVFNNKWQRGSAGWSTGQQDGQRGVCALWRSIGDGAFVRSYRQDMLCIRSHPHCSTGSSNAALVVCCILVVAR